MTPTTRYEGAFERIFWTEAPERDNFRARLFALFSEQIVRIWSRNEQAPYLDLGRPTLWRGASFATLDFALQRRSDGQVFVAEQKAELTWAGYSQLRLRDREQVDRHRGKPAFDWFLDLAVDRDSSLVKVKGRPSLVAGTILVWGAIEPSCLDSMRAEFGFDDVLAVEEILEDLRRWQDPLWRRQVAELRLWTDGLWDALDSPGEEPEMSGG